MYNTCCLPLFHTTTCVTVENNQSSCLGRICLVRLSVWATPSHIFVLPMARSGFQEDFLPHLSRDWAMAGQSVDPLILLLALLEDACNICLSVIIRNQIIKDGETKMVEKQALQWHWPAPTTPFGASHLVLWTCVFLFGLIFHSHWLC